MCIADIAISRRCYTRRTEVASGIALRIPPNPDRLALFVPLSWTGSGSVVIGLTQQDTVSGQPLVTGTSENAVGGKILSVASIRMDYQSHPGIVSDELWVYSIGWNTFAVETIMSDDLANELRQYLKEQRGKYVRK